MQNFLHSTNSKMPIRFPSNYPKEIVSGKGCYIYDSEDTEYIDFMCSLGPIVLGYRYRKVDEAVQKVIRDNGTIFSLSHPLEKELADLLCEMIPSAEMVKFFHNGKDPTEVAIRIARYHTQRPVILSFSYHGASDVFMACTPAVGGVPKSLKKSIYNFDYNDKEEVKRLFDKYSVAGVILEPHTIRMPGDFLEFLRDICNVHTSLLIFDEIVSFPRYPGFSAQDYFGVTPDLTCVSKGMGNGYPISALVGKEEYMKDLQGGVFASTTFGGNLIGVSASLATLDEVVSRDVPSHLNAMGERFKEGIGTNLTGIPCRQFFEFANEDNRWKLMQYCVERGVFFGIPIFFNYSHKEEHIDRATRLVNEALRKMDKIKLRGKPKEVFKKV